jgi:hypothetical protein
MKTGEKMKLEQGKIYYLDFGLADGDRKIYIAECIEVNTIKSIEIYHCNFKTIEILQDNDTKWTRDWTWTFRENSNDVVKEITIEDYPEYFI